MGASDLPQWVRDDTHRITLGVTVERHSKGVNFGIRVDGAESEDELMERVNTLWDKLEYRFGQRAQE